MNHGNHGEEQFVVSEIQRVPFFYFNQVFTNTVEGFDHVNCFGVAHQFDIRMNLAKQRYRPGVIRLHMIDNQIIDRGSLKNRLYFIEVFPHKTALNGIDERCFLSFDDVGVISNPARESPKPLKEIRFPVIHSNPVNGWCDGYHFVHKSLPLSLKRIWIGKWITRKNSAYRECLSLPYFIAWDDD